MTMNNSANTAANTAAELYAHGEALLARLEANPSDSACYASLGQIAMASGAYQDAVMFLGRAIQIEGPNPVYCVRLAESLSCLGENARALLCLEEAIRHADGRDLRFTLANFYYLENRHAEAKREYRCLVEQNPEDAEAWFHLGVLYTMNSELEAACHAYAEAVASRPNYAEAWNNLALIEHARRNAEAAETSYRRALTANPNYRDALYNFALLLQQQDRIQEAVVLYERLLALHPNFAEAHNNLGNCYLKLNRLDAAKSHYAETLSLQATHKEAPWNLGFASLLNGELESGWLGYEYRLAQRNVDPRRWQAPRWDGRIQAGERILVHHEQGLGDTIQFARYLHLLVRGGMDVDVLCQAPLQPLLSRIHGLKECRKEIGDLQPGNWQVPFPSLPYHFRTGLSSIPAEVPYLSADPLKVREWQELIAALPAGKKVGVVWQGNPKHENDRNRSLPVLLLMSLLDTPGYHFCSLQKGVATEAIPSGLTDLGRLFQDFGDTAAAVLNLDLVISVDTSVAHLAGALGKPVWVLLPYAPDWRWMLHRSDSPWYPSAQLFRQPMPGDWNSVIRQVRSALQLGV